MSRLIVLSNRVTLANNNPQAGGVAVAMADVIAEHNGVWLGWNGEVIDHADNGADQTARFTQAALTTTATANAAHASKRIELITTSLSQHEYQHFYGGFANSALWPLLHDQCDLISQQPQDYAVYEAVNRRFAHQLKKIAQTDDVIWVHDYHFLSVAYHCRALGMRNRIGFFLHIPFAPLPSWQQLPQSKVLTNHLAHYDVLGTQTQQDKANCASVINHYLHDCVMNTRASPHELAGGKLSLKLDFCATHTLTIDAYPIGVNVDKIQQQVGALSTKDAPKPRQRSGEKSYDQQIVAVDRIDYAKGLLRRLAAYTTFLQQYPAYQQQLVFKQIACPSRIDLPVYQQLNRRLNQAVKRVNERFTSPEKAVSDKKEAWLAIQYYESVLSHERLMKLFAAGDVCWVNSLKDGMNLVAKEYVAAQNADAPGVLVLSRYAGASEQMQAAVIINPYEQGSVIDGLHRALTMPLSERKSRHKELLHGLKTHDLHAWQHDFLTDLYGTI